jgi:hypothetical protein
MCPTLASEATWRGDGMTDISDIRELAGFSERIRNRHCERVPFDPERHLAEVDVLRILAADRWAPTAHQHAELRDHSRR